ncbi:MAG: SMC family ATPase, partial [Lachnospiraceae bacterium]|nr:SMC family ATPase [Lachnospiraceae bacterium]
MRPLRLKMSAFGPYSGNVEINMSDLGEHGLYLITGDTGAGKTTIFDAICFALFGNASGANREASMLRSKYADIATPTEVELLFSHADKEYIVKRNPEYMRPAKRGEGLKKETANAQLTYPDGRIVTRVKDVDMAIVELLGIDRNQFSQIAMLSQGEFLKLLLADTKSRQQIFRELFKTSYYQTLQYRLEDSRKEIYVKFSQTQESIKQYISSIMADEEDVLSIEAQKAKSGQMTTQDIIELIDKLLDSDNSKSDKKLEEQRIVEKELEKVNTDLGKAEELEKLKAALTKAKEALISFKSKESEFKDKVAKAKEGLARKEELFQQAAVIDAELARYKELDNITAIICDNLVRLKKYNANLQTGIDEQNKKLAEYENIKQELESLKEAGTEREKL